MNKEKTPWNPSKKATQRVKDPMQPPKCCNVCGKDSVAIKRNSEIYGKDYGQYPWIYLCLNCRSYVGMHPFTNIPLGTLADAKTRQARKVCKAPFEEFRMSNKISRGKAYSMLSKKMSIPKSECHFGMFDVDLCNRALSAVKEIKQEMR